MRRSEEMMIMDNNNKEKDKNKIVTIQDTFCAWKKGYNVGTLCVCNLGTG